MYQYGEVAERLKAYAWNAYIWATVSRVRIPSSPVYQVFIQLIVMITTTALLKHKYDSPSGNVSYVLFQPEQTFTFLEGQFCMIEAEIDGVTIKKPYSIASTNKQLQEEKLI